MRRILRTMAIAYLLYLALAMLVVLPVLNFVAPWYVEREYGRQLHTDLILFNPVALSLSVRGADLPETDGSPFLSLRKAEANLSLESLWQPGLVLDRIAVAELFLHLQRLEDGEFNIADFLPAESDSEPAVQDSEAIPALTVHEFRFGAERIQLTDRARETLFSTHYDGLDIHVEDLSTIIEEGRPYRLAASAESGGRLLWEGTISVPGAGSEGQFQLSGLSLSPFWRFAEPWLRFDLAGGSLDLGGRYQLGWGDGLSYRIDQGEVTVSNLAITPRDPEALPDTSVNLSTFSLRGISADSRELRAGLENVSLDGLDVAGWSEGDTVSLVELFDLSGLPASEPAAVPAPENSEEWQASIGRLELTNGALRWRSEYTDPPLLEITDLSASLDKLQWPLQGESQLALAVTANERAQVNSKGSLALASGDGQLSYQVEGIYLPWFNPNLPDALKATLNDGDIKVEGEVTLAGFTPSEVLMHGGIDNFSLLIEGAEDAVTSWERVRMEQLQVNLDQRSLFLKQLIIDNYQGRVHIAEDGSVNASKVWQAEVGEQAEELAQDLDLDEPWQVEIPAIYVSDSEIDFMDESLPLTFRTVIGHINGEVLNIGSDAGATTEVDMEGSVDGYAPVKLSGTARPLEAPPALDLLLTFDGVDLALLTPYSGTYAGYAIERGLLNLDLKYSLENNHLQGDNSVVIDQLKLGEPVDSDQAVDLPLELALALLTDANGVIDLAVPVSGNLDDPEFELGGVIGNAFMNLITKAVTAPFTLLAGLVGSEEDLQRIRFASGEVALDENGKARLDQLQQALVQRPKLTLTVIGRLNPEEDRRRLQMAALRQQLEQEGVSAKEIEDRDPQFIDAIAARYSALPSAASATEASLRQQYEAVLATIAVADAELLALTEQRAVAVKTYLVNEAGLAADRAVIEQGNLEAEDNRFSGVELGL